jgi:quercetin dioxygenase-like cupin family protein
MTNITSQNINQAVAYQEGSVVSKEMIKNQSGSVTLFAFDQDQGLSEHAAPYEALIMVTDGEAEIMVSGAKHQVKAGEMLHIPAGAPHALKAIEPFKMVLTMIKE